MANIHCPKCSSENVIFSKKRKLNVCEDCGHEFVIEKPFSPIRIFLSYGHDSNEALVRRILTDLENRGHDVWFDKHPEKEKGIKPGDDWRRKITDGIVDSQRVLSFLSKYSTRDPGVCRDEIAIAIGVKGGNIQTILVESEQEVQLPVNIGHIQWLDMHDWKQQHNVGEAAWEQWYQAKLAEIIRVVESDESRRFAGEIETLNDHLKPIKSESRICLLLSKGFYGRQWLFEAVEKWRQDVKLDSRLFWIMGAPGVGKSAFAAQLTHTRGDTVIAAQFCEWDKPDHRNAQRVVRSLAFQLATRLPDYRKLLLTLPEIAELDRKDAAELFDYLLANPLRSVINGGRERYLIVIDALDEAGEAGRNPLVEMLARNAQRLPDWIGLVVTSRPEFNVKTPLQALNPFPLDTKSESNRADIRDYLWHGLATQLQNRPDAARLVEQILEKSEGVFLYVEHFCDDVRLGHLSLDRPEQFPQGLGGIFCQYFQRQFPDLEKFREDVRPALRAILAAREPLPSEILQRIFDWKEDELHDFTRLLGSLFPLAKEGGQKVIKPYHKTLADWLAEKEKAGNYFVSVLEGHRDLAGYGWAEYQIGVKAMSRYSLSYLAYHLRQSGHHDKLKILARNNSFLSTQASAVPNNPDLPLQTIRIAMDAACFDDDGVAMAEFALDHARWVSEIQIHSPLEAARQGNLPRAFTFADQHAPEEKLLWYLLIFSDLTDRGLLQEAEHLWKKLRVMPVVRLEEYWQGEFGAFCLVKATVFEPLERWLDWAEQIFENLEPLSRAFASELPGEIRWEEALTVAERTREPFKAFVMAKAILIAARTNCNLDTVLQRANAMIASLQSDDFKATVYLAMITVTSHLKELLKELHMKEPEELVDWSLPAGGMVVEVVLLIAEVMDCSPMVRRAVELVKQENNSLTIADLIPMIAPAVATLGGTNPRENARQALELADQIDYGEDRALARARIAVVVAKTGGGDPKEILERALVEAVSPESPLQTAESLARLAPAVAIVGAGNPQTILARALRLMFNDKNGWRVRADVVNAFGTIGYAVASAGVGDPQDRARIALALFERIPADHFMGDLARIRIAQGVAVSTDQDLQTSLKNAMQLIEKIKEKNAKNSAWLQIAQIIAMSNQGSPQANVQEALVLVGRSWPALPLKRMEVLVQVARTMANNRIGDPQAILHEVLQQLATEATCNLSDQPFRYIGRAIFEVGGNPHRNAQEAVSLAQRIPDEESRRGVLIELAQAVVAVGFDLQNILQQELTFIDRLFFDDASTYDSNLAVHHLVDVAGAIIDVGGNSQSDIQPVLVRVERMSNRISRAKVLIGIARRVVEAAGNPALLLQRALGEVEQLEDEKSKAEELTAIALTFAGAGDTDSALHTAILIRQDRSNHLGTLVNFFGEKRNSHAIKALLIPCAFYSGAALQLCGALAQIYPSSACGISELALLFVDRSQYGLVEARNPTG